MKKSEPKIILNLSIENEELEEKVKIAMDKYAEQLVCKHLDETIAKIVDRRIDKLVNGGRFDQERKINGMTFEEYVKSRTEKQLTEVIDKNAKEMLAKKIVNLL